MFPSNEQLTLRAHGMAAATLRRHLAMLVECGLIRRKDSPNGKRYARKGRGGDIEEAFGFSLAPLLARAEELQEAAESVRATAMALKLMRERMTLHRRDIGKLIEVAVEETFPAIGRPVEAVSGRCGRHSARAGSLIWRRFVAELAALREEVDIAIGKARELQNLSANEFKMNGSNLNSNTQLSY